MLIYLILACLSTSSNKTIFSSGHSQHFFLSLQCLGNIADTGKRGKPNDRHTCKQLSALQALDCIMFTLKPGLLHCMLNQLSCALYKITRNIVPLIKLEFLQPLAIYVINHRIMRFICMGNADSHISSFRRIISSYFLCVIWRLKTVKFGIFNTCLQDQRLPL